MAKASRCYTGSRQSVGTPTMKSENYYQMMRIIRKEIEKRNAEAKAGKTEISSH